MQYAISMIFGGEPLYASDVAYDDVKAFQLVCPACGDAIHKVGNAITKRQYFAHFPLRADSARKSDEECELRVRAMMRPRFAIKPIVPTGQELDKFLAHFQGILMDRHPPDVRKKLYKALFAMRSRRGFHLMLKPNSFRESMRNVCEMFAAESLGALAYTPEMRDALRLVFKFIFAPNSRSVLEFAVAYGLILHCVLRSDDKDKIIPDSSIWSSDLGERLVTSSEKELRKLMASITENGSNFDTEDFHRFLFILGSAVGQTGCDFIWAITDEPPAPPDPDTKE